MTTLEIRKSGVTGRISMSYNANAGHLINFSDGSVFCFNSNKERQATWNKLLKMGFVRDINSSSDEMLGIANSTNAFDFKIISA